MNWNFESLMCKFLKATVTAFGARLDDDIAGEGVATAAREEEHAQLFEAGIKLMKRGEYKQAVTAFTRATAAAPGGLSDRKGGQYAIYLAEALQAAGRKKEAVGLLKRCVTGRTGTGERERMGHQHQRRWPVEWWRGR